MPGTPHNDSVREAARLRHQLLPLVSQRFWGELPDAEREQLEELVISNELARRVYTELLFDTAALGYFAGMRAAEPVAAAEPGSTTSANVPSPTVLMTPLTERGSVNWASAKSLSWLAATMVLAAMFWGVLAAWVFPRLRANNAVEVAVTNLSQEIGRLTAATDCRWEGSEYPDKPGDALHCGELYLAAGTAEFTFTSGVQVVIEGPTYLNLHSLTESFIHHGRLTATVPHSAVGFTVSTPNATIVDLGTEFDVEVSESGVTDVQVRRGMVEVAQPRKVAVRSTSKVRVSAGELVRVDELGLTPVVVATGNKYADRASIRRAASHVDLADIVAGGLGDAHRQGAGIHPITGRIMRIPELNDNYRWFSARAGTGAYIPAEDRPLVDGVSVPDPSKGPVKLDSAGHTFAGFPLTDGRTFGPIWAGGRVPMQPEIAAIAGEFCSTFDGQLDYSVAPHNLLAFIPNKLITFDLAAIRRVYPKRTLAAFEAVVGSTKPARMNDEPADVWVFVDGKLCYSRREINASHGPEAVKVPLIDDNRFLTLVSTDPGRKHNYDWVFFGDPRIEFKPKDEQQPSQPVPTAK